MAQTLETMIVINATVGNGFSDVGNTLTQLGGEIDRISQKLIDFGKESVKTYEDYEKNMAEARVALSTIYGRDTKALDDVMKQLDSSARDWASSTIFHTDDVGNAITEAARAGWDYEQIMSGIPVAMQLAQAGSIDLSDALYYITESAKAGGIAFEDLGDFVDLWAFAANSSNGTVESFGDSLLKLGATMRFTDSKEELFSLIALMHDMGESGSTAATLLRTSMMRILAPSGVAGSVMEELGATQEEIDAIREDAGKKEALNLLESYGFSAFDAEGQAKPILQIYSELGGVLAEIAGGYDNITKNQTTLGVLGTIFGTRGITGALDIVTALEHAKDLYEQMMNGDAVGYGDYASETMMDTYFGDVETWESKVENLRLRTGEVLTAQLSPLMESIGGIVDNVASLDTGSFNALVAGAEVLAAAGPGLLLAGGAFRFIGNALAIFANPVAGGVAAASLAAIGITELMAVMDEFEKADYAAQFGDMGLDNAEMMNYIQQVNQDFTNANKEITAFKDALDASVESYKTASTSFSSSLMQDVITGMEIKEGSEEYNKLTGLGDSMIAAIRDGITNSEAATMTSVTNLWGGDAESIEDPVWGQIISALETGYQEALDRAEALGKNLRQTLMDAISNDGKLDAGELAGIQSIMDEMNRLLTEQAEIENYVKQQEILRNAQRLGLEATTDLVAQMRAVNEANLETARKDNDYVYKQAELGFKRQIESGEISEDEAAEALRVLRERQESQMLAQTAAGVKAVYDTLDLAISGSDLGDAWIEAQLLAQEYWRNGGIANQDAIDRYNSKVSGKESGYLARYVESMVYDLGGYDNLRNRADYYESQGDSRTAQGFRNVMALFDMLGGRDAGNIGVVQAGVQGAGDYTSGMSDYEQINALLRGHDSTDTVETLADYIAAQRNAGMDTEWQGFLGNEQLYRQLNNLASDAGMTISAYIENAVSTKPVNSGEYTTLTPYSGGDAAQALQDQGVQVSVNGDTTELQATIDGVDGQTLMTYVDGDATNLSATITAQDGRTLVENVTGDASSLASAIDQYRNQTITVTVRANTASIPTSVKGFAEGGRSDVPAIFGEGDTAEWAIPEEHSSRTAELLNAARAASGFTWPELLGLYGGLNANPSGGQTTLVYSPTIYAQDATDVEQKLADDKARLEKWYEEKQMKEGLEVYT